MILDNNDPLNMDAYDSWYTDNQMERQIKQI